MQIGTDFSRHNPLEYAECNTDFVFLKASEGKTYRDPQMNEFMEKIAESHNGYNLPIIGFYHYARPENGNTPMEEAVNYLEAIKPHIGSCLYALDFEGDALSWNTRKKQGAWISEFLQIVHLRTKFAIPFLYMSSTAYRKLEDFIYQPHGYWIAHYDRTIPSFIPIGNDKYIHQFCCTKIDVNMWNGTRAELARYAFGI